MGGRGKGEPVFVTHTIGTKRKKLTCSVKSERYCLSIRKGKVAP